MLYRPNIGVRSPDYLNQMNQQTGQYFTGTNIPYPTGISKENNPHVYSPEEKSNIGQQTADSNSPTNELIDEDDKKLLNLFDLLNSGGGAASGLGGAGGFSPGGGATADLGSSIQMGQQIGSSLGFKGIFG